MFLSTLCSFVIFVRNSFEKIPNLTDEEKRDKIIEITNLEEGIAMALDTLANITQDEVEYARLCNPIKSELDYRT